MFRSSYGVGEDVNRVFAAATDAGRERELNEDSVLAEELKEEDGVLLAVADGMGGYEAGEVASDIALEVVRDCVQREIGVRDVSEVLRGSFQEANEQVYGYSSENPELRKVGTTLTAAVVRDGEAVIGHVGDSRAYVVDGDGIEQVTEDHSLIGDLLREGEISKEEARRNPMRNIVTRDVGTEPSVEVELFRVEVRGRLLLLCSDGLTEELTDVEIEEIVREALPLGEKAERLVEAAKEKGGSDNISVALLSTEESSR